MERVDRMMGRGVIDDEFYEELEEALLQADTSVAVTHAILDELRKAVREEKITLIVFLVYSRRAHSLLGLFRS